MTARKFELFELVKLHKPPTDKKKYIVDNILREYGHTPLRTPPYMCELNPIEMALAQIKNFIRDRNTSGDFGISKLRELVDEAIASVTPADWEKFCRHVVDIENKFWESDFMMEEIEPVIIQLGSADDSDTDDSDSDEGEDKEDSYIYPD